MTDWYDGPSLVEALEAVPLAGEGSQARPFRMAVQWVNRPNQDFRGFAGLISDGTVRPGDTVRVLPSGAQTTIKAIHTFDGPLGQAVDGQSVTLTLAEEVDCSRGDVISAADDPPQVADQFEASVVWMDQTAMKPGRGY